MAFFTARLQIPPSKRSGVKDALSPDPKNRAAQPHALPGQLVRLGPWGKISHLHDVRRESNACNHGAFRHYHAKSGHYHARAGRYHAKSGHYHVRSDHYHARSAHYQGKQTIIRRNQGIIIGKSGIIMQLPDIIVRLQPVEERLQAVAMELQPAQGRQLSAGKHWQLIGCDSPPQGRGLTMLGLAQQKGPHEARRRAEDNYSALPLKIADVDGISAMSGKKQQGRYFRTGPNVGYPPLTSWTLFLCWMVSRVCWLR